MLKELTSSNIDNSNLDEEDDDVTHCQRTSEANKMLQWLRMFVEAQLDVDESLSHFLNELKSEWLGALTTLNQAGSDSNKLLWIQPTSADLQFIKKAVVTRGLYSLVSVGCGNGFLEWLLLSATGLKVVGIEVDPTWWTSSYVTTYIPLIFIGDNKLDQIFQDDTAAIMFCYFNNGPAFREYLRQYKGNCLIIIGPKQDRHTDPHPYKPSFECNEWTQRESKRIQNTHDYIVLYDR